MRAALALVLAATVTGVHGTPSATDLRGYLPAASTDRVVPNDNRLAAGLLRGHELTLAIDARMAEWRPDGDSQPGASVPAFAEPGKAASIPGPLIRVPAGTVVSLTLRNALSDPLEVYGLVDRTASTIAKDAGVKLAPGETRTVRFRLDSPGTYYYWGTASGRPILYRLHEDAQLTGAIVVDQPGARPVDRVMVLGMWTDTNSRAYSVRKRILTVINGRSWPNTERLSYTVGDTVRWRVINATIDAHPMHLHGFYFRVDARGNGLVDSTYEAGTGDRVVTESVLPTATFSMSWVPDRAGNWLFHCHIPDHFAHRGPLGIVLPAASPAGHLANHALEGMGGFVTGVTVLPAHSVRRATASPVANESRRRHLRLLVRRNGGGSVESPFFGFAIQQGSAAPPADSGLRFGPPLVLTRGEPVSITVVNELSEPTAVHWHGIELESYFDGVAGFSGSSGRISPAIAPGDSFEAKFTPPRAGTFIYHTHVDEERQLLGGLAGAIVVLEPGERFDPSVDHVVLIGSPTTFADQQVAVLLDGSRTPAPIVLRANVRHRLRIVNMTVKRPVLLLDLLRDGVPAAWSLRAKDGADLPKPLAAPGEVRRTIGIGETLDFELTPDAPGDLRLDVRIGGPRPPHQLMGSLVFRVVP
jgi:manganese oxidase